MDRQELYDVMAARKFKDADMLPYNGGNGRVDRCVALFKQKKLRSGGKLLDVGGGIGDLGYAVRDLFDSRITVDISFTNLQAAEAKGNEVLHCDVDRGGLLELGDEEIDVITALDFIEHIIDPEKFVRECWRVLKPEGEVFINTPNIQFHRHVLSLIGGRFPHTSGDKEVFHGGHVAFFTYLDLCDIFGSVGFKKFEQFKDDEGYENPPQWCMQMQKIGKQSDYVDACMRLGNPNILFKAIK